MVDGADVLIHIHEVERRTRHFALDPERMRKTLDKQRLSGTEVAFEAEHGSLPDLLSNKLS